MFKNNLKYISSSKITEGDQIIFRNMRRAKKMPGTKKQSKYLGPMKVTELTDSHALVLTDDGVKTKKVPLHISKSYFPRSEVKRKNTDSSNDLPTKKHKENPEVIPIYILH